MVNGKSPLQDANVNNTLTGDRVISNTRAKIQELMEFANPRHNVHGAIKDYDGDLHQSKRAGKHDRDTAKCTTQTTKVTMSFNNVKDLVK
ncbi:unnamed protein product [Hermetia illucens]|uniref:Uncharacterized protein n=1 Tax=Hermetia illucens TaxID=343691 RepID=A0A7R8ULP3_HERIL|nr:unnamed protein product [Hermetia illucens]